MTKKTFYTLLITCFCFLQSFSQSSSVEIYNQLKKLNFLGSALYIAAHPDDENTALISYLSNHVNAHTAYLSMTRGDGGQNLIGTELRELLGVIRTEELMQARNIDNGNQYFTSAVDFGFSKHPRETLNVWNKKQILGEVVNRIRMFQPDIIINRFDYTRAGRTHGHHTSSALLSKEAFALSNNAISYPGQLKTTELWQAKRLFFNTSWWFYGSRENFNNADKSDLVALEIGVFDPLTGTSNNEIAARSRSSHKSQGFGSSPSLGGRTEYLKIIEGEKPQDNNLFSGINTTWSRVDGGDSIGEMVTSAIENFDFKHPQGSVEALVQIHEAIKALPSSLWKDRKLADAKKLIMLCSGLQIKLNAEHPYGVPGELLKVGVSIVQQSDFDIKLESIETKNNVEPLNESLTKNNALNTSFEITLANKLSTPYWLLEKGDLGTFSIKNKHLIGKPQTPDPIVAKLSLNIKGTSIHFEEAVKHRKTDPVRGEVINPFYILPAIGVNFEQPVFLYPNKDTQTIRLNVTNYGPSFEGDIELCYPKGWEVDKTTLHLKLKGKGSSQFLEYKLTPTEEAESGLLNPLVIQNDKKENVYSVEKLEYNHIPKQFIAKPSESKAVRLNLNLPSIKVGYIAGAGDTVMERLSAVGLSIEPINIETITLNELKKYDAVLIGIRAFNVIESLAHKNQLLFDFVEAGGTLVTQYNTNRRLKTNKLAPFSIKLSRDRVTDEFSDVRILDPKHPALNSPHKITSKDFEGWVQERGLYFPNQWDNRFTPLLGMNDTGESEKLGSILVANHGSGTIVYTGLSFFRELPAGVPGAYRLLINLLAL